MSLTISLKHAAEILGTTPPTMRAEIKRKKIAAIQIGGEARISLFVLAKMLGTTPIALLNLLEDDAFGRLLEQADREEGLTAEEARRRYAEHVQQVKAA